MSAKTSTKEVKKAEPSALAPLEGDFFNAPFMDLRRQMDRVFDSFASGWHLPALGASWDLPSRPAGAIAVQFDLSESDDAYEITAELPGMDEKDVEVTLENGLLTMKGEKKAETEQKKKDYHVMERHYGAFRRSFRLPENVEEGKIKAAFDKGVLRLTLPKSAEAKRKTKKIAISRA